MRETYTDGVVALMLTFVLLDRRNTMTTYVKQRMFERLISELEQSLEHMTDNDLERIIFLCWSEQQSRVMKEDEYEKS